MTDTSSPSVLSTSRLRLRPITDDDAVALHDCYGDPEVMSYWDLSPSRDLTQTASRVKQSLMVDPVWHAIWAVLPRDSDRAIGMVNYNHREPAAKRLEVGYALARPYWRRGYMTEAMRAFLGYCFEDLQSHRVEALVDQRNAESVQFTKGLGFREEGLLRERDRVAGCYRNLWMFALLEDEWRAKSGMIAGAAAASRD